MSWWIELHCDVLAEWPDDQKGFHSYNHCFSNNGDSPGLLAANTSGALKHLRARAKAAGWKKIKEGWACPRCAKTLD
jgi:hypothetical protein